MEEKKKTEEETKTEEKKGIALVWSGLKKGFKEAGQIIKDNPMMIIPILGGTLRIVGKIISTASGAGNYDHCMVTDDITGEDFLTIHPLTNSEILNLGDRMSEGQSKGEALSDMGLLRNEKKRK